mmetsp:Transcript_12424/g.15121  ORF Transcript_12424/g.15121 Transcript_12424/m.15121 type:complete len:301 (-) Transcript_12424:147-1049(-)
MSAGVARGPLQLLLQSAAGQYGIIVMGVFTMFPEKVQSFLPVIQKVLLEVSSPLALQDNIPNLPIIIHTGNAQQARSITSNLVSYLISSGAVCVVYLAATNALPTGMKEMLPVTRKFFESTTKALSLAVVNVREVIEEQILGLTKKQDQLMKKQDETNNNVLEIGDDLAEARLEISTLGNSLGRCETSLAASKQMQSYTLRGVKLLVRCINTIAPNSDSFTDELVDFINDGKALNVGINFPRSTEPRKSSLLQLNKSFPVTPVSRSSSLPLSMTKLSSPLASSEKNTADGIKYINELLGR